MEVHEAVHRMTMTVLLTPDPFRMVKNMENLHVIDSIPLEADVPLLLQALRIRDEGPRYHEFINMLDDARAIVRPKVMYRLSFIDEKSDDAVVVDGVTLQSRVLRINLEGAHRAFPFVVTCGKEIEEWAASINDIVRRFWSDTIMGMALGSAFNAFIKDLDERYRPGKTATMNPGSLEDWPIQEQSQLFRLLGDVHGATGVELMESMLMRPLKTISGIQFSTESGFVNCSLCPRQTCTGRRAPYDGELKNRKYGA
jgi:hypothetical protein